MLEILGDSDAQVVEATHTLGSDLSFSKATLVPLFSLIFIFIGADFYRTCSYNVLARWLQAIGNLGLRAALIARLSRRTCDTTSAARVASALRTTWCNTRTKDAVANFACRVAAGYRYTY